MALPDSAKYVDGTSFIFAFDTDWPASPTQGWSATVDAEIDLGSLADDGYRESVKCDLTANYDVEYKVEVSVETDTDATSGGTIDVYAGFSDSATAGTGNPAGLAGVDQAYAGGAGGTAATGVKLLEFVGSLVLQATQDTDAVPQVGVIGMIRPSARYMMIVVHNQSGATLGSGGTGLADELAVRVTGQTLQLQD
jgi:hypothetical protein